MKQSVDKMHTLLLRIHTYVIVNFYQCLRCYFWWSNIKKTPFLIYYERFAYFQLSKNRLNFYILFNYTFYLRALKYYFKNHWVWKYGKLYRVHTFSQYTNNILQFCSARIINIFSLYNLWSLDTKMLLPKLLHYYRRSFGNNIRR